jgi:regulator of nucleoside diphosphate kinase
MIATRSNEPSVLLVENDFAQLSLLAESHKTMPVAQFLGQELDRARVVKQTNKRIVRLGSRVLYHDLSKAAPTEITLVMPHDSDIKRFRVSVLTPIGAALIGLEEGERITFSMPWTGTRTVAVVRVIEPAVNQ